MVNCELQKLREWFRANQLSLNVTKINYTLRYVNFESSFKLRWSRAQDLFRQKIP